MLILRNCTILAASIPNPLAQSLRSPRLFAPRAISTMTGTPTLFADTPTRVTCSGGAPDLLSEMLRAVRLTGSVFFSGSFTAPCAVISPKRWNQGTPLAPLRHISVFYLVVSGHCSMERGSGERPEV